MNKIGKAYLVGAGPGEIGLITVKGLEILKIADVVLYDRLANMELLQNCKKDAELVFVGKEQSKHYVTQNETIRLLIQKVKEGKIVVRLKGGDPFIFGRGSEEAIALYEEGLQFEIIPGLTAALGASAYSGIPLTHRNIVTQCVFITAHEAPGKETTQIDWKLLASMKNTSIVIYMGASMLPLICEVLIQNGMDKNTPVGIVENATLPNQRIVEGDLTNIAKIAADNNIKPPVITIISPTVELREKIKWLERKPLFNKRIVTTRPADQTKSLSYQLEELGANVIQFSVIRTEISEQNLNPRNLFNNNFDWIFFTSENGVRYFFQILFKNQLDARILGGIKIGVIGKGTSRELEKYGLKPDFVPSKFTSLDFANEFCKQFDLKNLSILRIKGDFFKDILTEEFNKYGIKLTEYEVYKLIKDVPSQKVISDLNEKGADAFLFTSSSTVNNFFEIMNKDNAINILNKSVVISIGPVTSEALKNNGIHSIIEAKEQSVEGMVEAAVDILRKI